MIVEAYYITRVGFVILPKLLAALAKDEDGDVDIYEEIIQFTIALVVIFGIIISHWPKIFKTQYVKYLLFLQGIQMSITNFHRYRSPTKAEDDQIAYKNFQFFNTMSVSFTTTFTITNCLLIA